MNLDLDKLPICMAKLRNLYRMMRKIGRPTGFKVTVRELNLQQEQDSLSQF